MPKPDSNTISVALSDAAIKRHANDPTVKQLSDSRRPVLFRYHAGRASGSWYVVTYHKGKPNPYSKIANWPALSAADFMDALPKILQRLAVDPSASVALDQWQTLGELLTWYLDRNKRDRNKSTKRKDAIRSVIKCHLRPRLAGEPLSGMNQARLDELLIWPLQETYKLSYVRQVFGVLMVALKQASKLKLISVNPLADLSFPDFIETRIEAKPGAIRPDQVRGVLAHLISLKARHPVSIALAVMMLAHGTRIGETRLSKWKNINLEDGEWFIPAADAKTRKEMVVPLTAQICTFLRAYRDQQKASNYDGAYLFPARNGQSINPKQADELFKPLGAGEWTSHDLRKVARTCWADLDVEHQVGEFLLNHQLPGISATYIHTTLKKQKRAALECWHAWLDDRGFAELTGFHAETEARQAETTTGLDALNGMACSAA
ncbi:tyrosine-type recombinase/integrase [Pseudomonas quasicaspiana]|uniref:tyrosine-type recombinase/integrase n=1 Tax=Pseudomonas quasicaspiana TaxID=2829821 RepID=UPI001E3A67F8|nr:site-specific integrase [Pseudomonas quasicaspiana]MCD5980548.1 site-specific integrase [Pseudomonas quasicaspiana]